MLSGEFTGGQDFLYMDGQEQTAQINPAAVK